MLLDHGLQPVIGALHRPELRGSSLGVRQKRHTPAGRPRASSLQRRHRRLKLTRQVLLLLLILATA